MGWAGVKNGRLLALAAAEFYVLLTPDQGMEFQQNLATLPVSILIEHAHCNRIDDSLFSPVLHSARAPIGPLSLWMQTHERDVRVFEYRAASDGAMKTRRG